MQYQELLTYINGKQFIWQHGKELDDFGTAQVSRPYIVKAVVIGDSIEFRYFDKDQNAQTSFRHNVPEYSDFAIATKENVIFRFRHQHNGFVSVDNFYQV